MKKTILVSALTTLATLFVVVVIVHICKSNCGNQSKCGVTPFHSSSNYGGGHHGFKGKCSSYSDYHGKKNCKSSSKSCKKGDAKCSKGKKCCKSKASCDKTTKTCKSKKGNKTANVPEK